MKQPDHSKRIQWPHYIDHDNQQVFVTVNSWISASGAANAVKKWYPGYELQLVSGERLDEVKKETK